MAAAAYDEYLPEFRSAEEEKAFHSFKASAAELSSDNAVLIRFLRARKLDEAAALEQLKEAVEWRQKVKADSALDEPAPKADLMTKLVPHAFLGHDKQGRPLYIERTGKVDVPRLLNLISGEEQLKNHVAGYEHQLRRCRENTVKCGRLVTSTCNVMDLEGLSLSHKKGLESLQSLSSTDERVYPETLGRLYLVNAPWIFSVFWKIVRGWMDENTRSKIVMLGSDYKERLLEEIDASELPVEYGGTCEAAVPEAFAAADLSVEEFDPELTEEVVPAGKAYVRELRVDDPEGATFSWFFRTAKKDIRFAVTWHPDTPERHGDEELSEVPVVPLAAVSSQKVRVEGMYLVNGPGRCVFTWDNKNSWTSSKTVRYNLGELDLGRGEEHSSASVKGAAEE